MIEITENRYKTAKKKIARYPRLMVSDNKNIYIMTGDRKGFRLTGPGKNYTFCDTLMFSGNFTDYEGTLELQNEED